MIRRSPRAPVCFLTACAATALSARDVKLRRAKTAGPCSGEAVERIRGKSSQQLNPARSEQVGVLLDERELWFLQDPNQVALRERFQSGRDGNAPDESGSSVLVGSAHPRGRSWRRELHRPRNSLGDQTKLDEVLRFDLLEQRTQILLWRIHLPCAADDRGGSCRLRDRGKSSGARCAG